MPLEFSDHFARLLDKLGITRNQMVCLANKSMFEVCGMVYKRTDTNQYILMFTEERWGNGDDMFKWSYITEEKAKQYILEFQPLWY